MKIGIIGGGRMAKDVFNLFQRFGHSVTLYVRRPDAASVLDEELLGVFRRRAASSSGRAAAAKEQLEKLKVTSTLEDLADCDLINENIAEDLEAKRVLFAQLEAVVRPDCILTSDSSFLTPDRIAEGLRNPGRFLNLHFFYPMKLTSFIEVIPGAQTAPEILAQVTDVARELKVRPILCRSISGFLVNRMIPAFYIEGVLLLEEGWYTASEIDQCMTAAHTHIGPLAACDQIGLDLVGKENSDTPDLWRAGWIHPTLLGKLVEQGRLGVKTGAGIFRYEGGKGIDETPLLPKTDRYQSLPRYERSDMIERLSYTMVVEAFRQLDLEVGSAEDIDYTLKEVLGFRTGPIVTGLAEGPERLRERLLTLAARFGERFMPRGRLA